MQPNDNMTPPLLAVSNYSRATRASIPRVSVKTEVQAYTTQVGNKTAVDGISEPNLMERNRKHLV